MNNFFNLFLKFGLLLNLVIVFFNYEIYTLSSMGCINLGRIFTLEFPKKRDKRFLAYPQS